MTDDRDICERLEDTNYDGAFAMRREAAKLIRQLRHYVDRLEDDLREADLKTESLRKHIAKQQLDIVILGKETGRMREALEKIAKYGWSNDIDFCSARGCESPRIARAAIGEEKK
jgi:hypothetical protein